MERQAEVGELWLAHRYRETEPPFRPFVRAKRIDDSPMPTITAGGIGPNSLASIELLDRPPPGARITEGPRVGSRNGNGKPPPPYKVPTMRGIRRRKKNGLKVISTFAAGGGSSTGYRMAGFEVVAAVEYLERAAESYRANHPEVPVIVRDVREVPGAELLELTGLERGELDVLDGSPPCEPFSSAGKRDKGWSGDQDLFFDYARLVDELRPRAFVAENVKGLIKGRAVGYFKRIHRRLEGLGYRVEARVLDAQWLGVPQARERLIFVGIREDLERDPAFPKPWPFRYTVRDALPHVFRVRQSDVYDEGDRVTEAGEGPSPTITAQGLGAKRTGKISVEVDGEDEAILSARLGAGFKREDLDPDAPAKTVGATESMPEWRVEEPRFVHDTGSQSNRSEEANTRDRADEPAPTITVGGSEAHHNVGANANHYLVEEPVEEPRLTYNEKGRHVRPDRTRDLTDRPSNAITAAGGKTHNYLIEDEPQADEIIVGNEAFEARFGAPDQPSPTILATGSRTAGEVRDSRTRRRRKLTIDELKAICGFPPDYELVGTYGDQWERLGDAVPPLMMREIAKALAPVLLD